MSVLCCTVNLTPTTFQHSSLLLCYPALVAHYSLLCTLTTTDRLGLSGRLLLAACVLPHVSNSANGQCAIAVKHTCHPLSSASMSIVVLDSPPSCFIPRRGRLYNCNRRIMICRLLRIHILAGTTNTFLVKTFSVVRLTLLTRNFVVARRVS